MDNDENVQAILAVHLFAPLFADIPGADKYGINNQQFAKDIQHRVCPLCGEKLNFTDTSFGEFVLAT